MAIKTLHSHHYSKAHKKVEEFRDQLKLVQQDHNINVCEDVQYLLVTSHVEESILHQKSKIQNKLALYGRF